MAINLTYNFETSAGEYIHYHEIEDSQAKQHIKNMIKKEEITIDYVLDYLDFNGYLQKFIDENDDVLEYIKNRHYSDAEWDFNISM
jgi:hypothetical protein